MWGVERSLEGTPRPVRNYGSMVCDKWGGAESRWNGARPEVNDNEHLCQSPVSSPTEEIRKNKRRSDDSER